MHLPTYVQHEQIQIYSSFYLGTVGGCKCDAKLVYGNEPSFEKITSPRDKVMWCVDKFSRGSKTFYALTLLQR